MSDLNARLEKLEEERDFYRALLESPKRGDLPAPGDAGFINAWSMLPSGFSENVMKASARFTRSGAP